MSTQTSQAIFPEVGDLVVATVKRVEDYGAYVKLDEFAGIEGLVHISEMATTWVRNIRDHAREGQKLVLKVLRVNPQRNQIDLSLRRVTGREKSEKMLEWKKERKAEAILKSAAEKMNKPEEDAEAIKNTARNTPGSQLYAKNGIVSVRIARSKSLPIMRRWRLNRSTKAPAMSPNRIVGAALAISPRATSDGDLVTR